MSRRVKDSIEISEHTPLDDLIRFLQAVRDSLPPSAEPELTIRGDDIFGRRLTIRFLRELTPEEAAIEAKYAGAAESPAEPAIEALRGKLDKVPYQSTKKRRR
jgi:hypothetical protein